MAEIEDLKIVGGSTYTVGNQDIIANEWQAGITYVKGKSYVIREHKLYVCNVTHTSVEPFDATKWTEITVGEAIAANTTAIGSLSTLTTTDKSSLVGAVNEVNKVTALTISGVPTGVTNNSKAYKINEGLILIMIEVTFANASSSWQNAFDIDWSGRTIVNAFGALSNDNDNNTYAQAYWNTDKITVRVSSPKATLYRGQILVPAT